MKKVLPISIVIICFSFIGCAESDFRNTQWGMNVEEVKKAEDAEFIEERTDEEHDTIQYLDYSVEILDIPARLNYVFRDNNSPLLDIYLNMK